MKVSPEYFIQLSQRVKYCTKEREMFIYQVQGEKVRKQAKGQESLLLEPKCKGTGNTRRTGQRTGLLIIVCILTSPGQKIGYDLENQSNKTGDNTSN